MDYKLLIILLALLFLIILVYKELGNIKNEIIKNIFSIITNLKQNNEKFEIRLNNNMLKCVSQIREINTQNLQQLRKISLLNNQPITKFNNHFTEIEDSDMHTDINYLSDKRTKIMSDNMNSKIFQKNPCPEQKNSTYYMSNDSETSPTKSSFNKNCNDQVCILKCPDNLKNNQKLQNDIPIYVCKNQESSSSTASLENKPLEKENKKTENANEVKLLEEYKDKNYKFIEEEHSTTAESDTEYVTLLNFINNPKNYNEIDLDIFNILPCNKFINNIKPFYIPNIEINQKINKQSESIKSIIESIDVNDFINVKNSLDYDVDNANHILNNGSCSTSSSNQIILKSYKFVNDESKKSSEDSKSNKLIINTDPIKINNNLENSSQETNKTKNSISNSKKKPNLTIKTNQINLPKNNNSDNSSYETNITKDDISIVSKPNNIKFDGELKPIKNYSISELRNIAKNICSIPLSHNEEGKRKLLKKEELYESIQIQLKTRENKK
ncbi:Hypothetical protein KVN_LOCUS457 [uncultured virus]|nr:Hypothetical protein KVN_LOCUS457 [uncultured virus]